MLDALCSAVGWADVKQLHDSLGYGFSELKTDLQHYFIGKRGYGPDIGHEWEHHDSSLHGLVGRLGGAGAVLNFALDVGTFGFNSSYGKALDDRSEGRTSEAEASRAKMHAAGRTAAIAAISMLTGGLADKLVRGNAATVSRLRAIGAGAAGGSTGGVSALAASGAYGNLASGDQHGFSSPEEYVKALLLGGVIGGAVGGVTQGLGNSAARRYVPNGSAEPPSSPRSPLGATAKDAPSNPRNRIRNPPRGPRQQESTTRPPTGPVTASLPPARRNHESSASGQRRSRHSKASRTSSEIQWVTSTASPITITTPPLGERLRERWLRAVVMGDRLAMSVIYSAHTTG